MDGVPRCSTILPEGGQKATTWDVEFHVRLNVAWDAGATLDALIDGV